MLSEGRDIITFMIHDVTVVHDTVTTRTVLLVNLVSLTSQPTIVPHWEVHFEVPHYPALTIVRDLMELEEVSSQNHSESSSTTTEIRLR